MIKMSLYKKLCEQWRGKIYQSWDKEWKRFNHFSGKQFEGKNVLEIGSNAGVQTLEISQYAKSVIAVEQSAEKFEQLKITMKNSKNPNVELLNCAFQDFALMDGKQYDTLYTSFVIYHFSDYEISLLVEKVLPKVNTWVLYNRAEKRKPKNSYRFEDLKATAKFMVNNGFDIEVEWQKQKIWYFIKGTRK